MEEFPRNNKEGRAGHDDFIEHVKPVVEFLVNRVGKLTKDLESYNQFAARPIANDGDDDLHEEINRDIDVSTISNFGSQIRETKKALSQLKEGQTSAALKLLEEELAAWNDGFVPKGISQQLSERLREQQAAHRGTLTSLIAVLKNRPTE